jgi:hypothetical protein
MTIAQTLPVADTWGMHGDVGTGWMLLMMALMVLFWGDHPRHRLADQRRHARRVGASGERCHEGEPPGDPRTSLRGGCDLLGGLPGTPGSSRQ